MIYLIYLSQICTRWYRPWSTWSISDLDHDIPDLSLWSRSWSIWSICPRCALDDLDHDLPDLSLWSRSWSIWSICPRCALDNLNHDLPDLSLIWIMIYLIYLSDLDHDLSDISVRGMKAFHVLSSEWSVSVRKYCVAHPTMPWNTNYITHDTAVVARHHDSGFTHHTCRTHHTRHTDHTQQSPFRGPERDYGTWYNSVYE